DPSESGARVAEPCCFVLFGAAGDLARRLIFPALYNLADAGLLPEKFCILGVDLAGPDRDALRDRLRQGLDEFATRPVRAELADRLLGCLEAVRADPADPRSAQGLKARLDALRRDRGIANHLFYLAVPPVAFLPTARMLGAAGLLREDGEGWRRLVIEKPFGTDLASARRLNADLLGLLDEEQIYRIDHYLGKETVQNIMVLRFTNGMFEPVWNRSHIDHVQITVAESIDVGTRGRFYEQTGALRDMVPNHLFQLLSLVAMEPPSRFDARSVRSDKAEALAAVQIQTEAEARANSVRGQYLGGCVGTRQVGAYRETADVAPDSTVETFVALKLSIDNWRWAGVPFYLRTGKAMAAKRTEIAIRFKQAPLSMFRTTRVERLSQNFLVLGIEPFEGVTLQFNAKVPGPRIAIDGVAMTFRYEDHFRAAPKTGYETLIYDCMIGDNLLFQRADSVEAGWQAVQPFLDAWDAAGGQGLAMYAPGGEGPAEAAALLERDGRRWRPVAGD
ncbi:MAG TPA: glucose-6-phosphate dehydrogenase, partial [Paracoccus sp. (in: a-proteobacteria)]|nr:glucose-6-phosphate dehydrogenase [Paracoccus sp. (in: a-proteobacteria)]